LYAKPSYTGAEGCSFPYSYVEPYPEFYKRLGDYANDAAAFFSGNEVLTGFSTNVDQYFRQFADIMSKLEVLAQKELDNQPFSTEEASWLKQMLIKLNYGMCGEMPFDGWILDLYWNQSKLTESDFINVDVHTQPAEASGQVVGKVLHAGLGKLNMGVCLAKIPGSDKMVAYTGAFMSYYENITTNYLRLTDKEWEAKVLHGDIPERPEWVSAYLVTKSGTAYPEQKSLPTSMLLGISPIKTDDTNVIAKIFPNPANDFVNVQISGSIQDGVEYSVTDICGRVLKSGLFATNRGTIDLLNFPKGVYLLKLSNGANHQFVKVVKE
jgi:hypothetical protein